jgi:hypothetical protein
MLWADVEDTPERAGGRIPPEPKAGGKIPLPERRPKVVDGEAIPGAEHRPLRGGMKIRRVVMASALVC